MYKVIHKPWGKEEWLELNDSYCYKRIYINAGYKTSYQYHNFKKETNYIIDGTAEVWLENDEGIVEKTIMKAGDFFNVTPPKKHRVIAITDIILQEVSTPHVDDVIRIGDEFNRGDGKIQAEHNTPAVLILAAGLGTRLGSLTKDINKAMLPINNKAIISHIIEKFPIDYEFVISLGYKGSELREYCELAHPNHKFIFVDVDKYEGVDSGPGYSTLMCKNYLQRPFYFITADCIVDCKIPHLDGNWLGVNLTAYPEKYATLKTDIDNNILELKYKNQNGFENAFIGLASIWDYEIFWKELETNIKDGELVSAFENPKNYPSFKTKILKWFDTGNIDDLLKAREHFNDTPLSLYKNTGEIVYKTTRFLKFNSNKSIIKNKSNRADILKNLIPDKFKNTDYFISYEWAPGKTLYEYDNIDIYKNFLNTLISNIKSSKVKNDNFKLFDSFYKEKTNQRIDNFIKRFGQEYFKQKFVINNKVHNTIETLLQKFDVKDFYTNPIYTLFHGDLQFANVLYNTDIKKFIYLDWRESFGGSTDVGDVYYDLAKLYGGCIIPYDKMTDETFLKLEEGSTIINYEYSISDNLKEFKIFYENWLIDNGFDIKKVKLITGLIFLNMSPLHDDKFSKLLWYKSIELLDDYYK